MLLTFRTSVISSKVNGVPIVNICEKPCRGKGVVSCQIEPHVDISSSPCLSLLR